MALVNADGDQLRLGFICFFSYKGHMGNFCLNNGTALSFYILIG
jgi:hypothetical protein